MTQEFTTTDIDGNELVVASSYGCGAESCIDCYPYFTACECGEVYARPIPNDGRDIDECDHDIDEDGYALSLTI